MRDYLRLAVTAGLAILATLWLVDWSNTKNKLKKGEQESTRKPLVTNLATNQHSPPEAQLQTTRQDAQQVQQNPDLATTQQSAPGSRLKKAQEEKPQENIAQSAQPNADLAAFHNSATDTRSQKEREHFQAAQEDARLATDRPQSRQIQPLNPVANEMPSAPLQPLDPSVQPAHP